MLPRLTALVLLLLLLGVAFQAAYSLSWRIAHDLAPLLYEAYLMKQGWMPYRDFYDFQMPGSYAMYALIGRLSHFDDLPLRALDVTLLLLLIGFTFTWMREFGIASALTAGLLFGWKYLQGGPSLAWQREYLIVFFLALTLAFLFRERRGGSLFGGIALGLASGIKPQSALGLLPILLYLGLRARARGEPPWRRGLALLGGFLLPLGGLALWLWWNQAWGPFGEIALNYWPLYAQISGKMEILQGTARTGFI